MPPRSLPPLPVVGLQTVPAQAYGGSYGALSRPVPMPTPLTWEQRFARDLLKALGQLTNRLLLWTDQLFLSAVLMLIVASVLGYFVKPVEPLGLTYGSSLQWFMDLSNHGRALYTMGLALAFALYVLSARWGWALLSASALAYCIYGVMPFAMPSNSEASTLLQSPAITSLKVVHINVFEHNMTPKKLWDYLANSNADLISLNEVGSTMRGRLEASGLLMRYPYRAFSGEDVALLSRYPLGKVHKHSIAYPYGAPRMDIWLDSSVEVNGQTVQLALTHPRVPLSVSGQNRQLKELTEVAQWTKLQTQPTLVIGDLNNTPYTQSYQQFIKNSGGLTNINPAPALHPTWLTPSRKLPLGLTIDHILVKNGLRPTHFEIGPVLGSDHRPVVATVQLTNQTH